MNKYFRKSLAGVLAALMIMSSMPTVFADELTTTSNSDASVSSEISEVPDAETSSSEVTVVAEPEATAEPIAEPTAVPTVEPTAEPTVEPTAVATDTPSATPTTAPATAEPTAEASTVPSATPQVTAEPTIEPTAVASPIPSIAPEATTAPTTAPTVSAVPTTTPEPYQPGYVVDKTNFNGDLLWPVPSSGNVTQGFGGSHTGIDISADYGADVISSFDGTVNAVQTWDGATKTGMQSYGNMIELKLADGTILRYAHLSEIDVKVGDEVRANTVIGKIGSTGNSTGNHLHFEVRIDGSAVNPYSYITGGVITSEESSSAEQAGQNAPEPVSTLKGECEGGKGYLQKYGVTRADVVNYLSSHEHDNFFLGTPYWGGDHQSPNGDISYNGVVGMNCGGFVSYVLRHCTSAGNTVGNIIQNAMIANGSCNLMGSGLPYDRLSGASNYKNLLGSSGVCAYVFSSPEELLSSGKAEKGDIIICYWNDQPFNDNADNHIGFFWGDTPSDNKFWHSNTHPLNGNQISVITPKTNGSSYILMKTDPPHGTIKVIKKKYVPYSSNSVDESGATFQIYLKSAGSYNASPADSRDIITTDAKGSAMSKPLPRGSYIVKQISGAEGYELCADRQVNIQAEQVYQITNYNKFVESAKIQVKKTDANGKVLAGAKFKVTSASTGNTLGTMTSGSNGIATLEVSATIPKVYVQEITSPAGYELDSTKYPLDVTPNAVLSLTIKNPKSTVATELTYNSSHMALPLSGMYLTDKISYTNLTVGKTYTYKGLLYVKETGKLLTENGKNVTGETTFKPTSSSGTAYISYVFDSMGLAGKTVVATGTLYEGSTLWVTHKDLNDTKQAVKFYTPKMTTVLSDSKGNKTATAVGTVYMKDTITYSGIPAGTYTIKEKLINKATGKVITVGGKEITGSTTFTTTGSGTAVVPFTFDATGLDGVKVVAFCYFYKGTGSNTFAKEEDLNNANQSLRFLGPNIETTATYDNGEKSVVADKTHLTIVDKVEFEGLVKNTTYTISGVIMDKSTGKEFLDANGQTITATKTFEAAGENGYINVQYSFDVPEITKDTNLVVFETLTLGSKVLVTHENINDKGQTVSIKIPKVGTTAHFGDNIDEHDYFATDEDITIIDTVEYKDVTPNKELTLKAALMDRTNGIPFKDAEGNEITSEVTFTPTEGSGTIDVTFTFSGKTITENTMLTVFETLYRGGREIANHTDINDDMQTVVVHAPKLQTTATVNDIKDMYSEDKDIQLIDVVEYTDLMIYRPYTVKGVLMDKSTGKPLIVDGEEITSEATFTPNTADGSVEVVFSFNLKAITKTTELVAFETLSYDNRDIAVHADIEDKGQTIKVYVPEIGTTAVIDGEKEVVASDKEYTLVDTVAYTDLIIGKEYEIKGTLMNKTAGGNFEIGGKAVTSAIKFTPTETSGTVDVTFKFNLKDITETTEIVAFETLYNNKTELAVHADLEDKGQTVKVRKPKIGTTANIDGEKETIAVDKEYTLVDTVTYKDLIVGKEYEIKGTLMDKATGKEFKVDGKTLTSSVKFTAEKSNGTIDISFKFNLKDISKTTQIVAFETVSYKGIEIAVHADLKDEDQTVVVHTPKIGTTAVIDDVKEVMAGNKEYTLIDTVTYKDLIVGKEYVVTGTLMDKNTGKEFMADGKVLTSTVKFTAKTSDGTIDVPFKFNLKDVTENTELVVFETVTCGKDKVAVHTDINDKGQTVTIKRIQLKTTATIDSGKESVNKSSVTVDDVVEYKDLIVGKEYVIKGTLMDKSTGKAFVVNGKEVTSEVKFTATKSNGSVTMKFTFDASGIKQNTTLVAFEYLYHKGIAYGVHANLEDKDQTVIVRKPTIGTTATINSLHSIKVPETLKSVTIVDKVDYKGLTIGEKYKVSGVLMNKDGTPYMQNGKPLTAETEFVAKTKDGSVNVTFVVDTSNLSKSTTLVVFETLTCGKDTIAEHKDINDNEQSVYLNKVTTNVQTGDNADTVNMLLSIMALAGLAFAVSYIYRKKHCKN